MSTGTSRATTATSSCSPSCSGRSRGSCRERAAARELLFHLEREADGYAVARCHDPAVLASAICKAAQGATLAAPALGLGGGLVTRRIRLLLDGDPLACSPRKVSLRALATVMAGLVVLSAAALPSAAHAGFHVAGSASAVHHCAVE
jgi:hypothetical protein